MTGRRTMTRELALAIRDAYSVGATTTKLAREHGISLTLVCLVVEGRHATTSGLPSIARRRGAPAGPQPPCGTARGYEWHRRHGVPIDQACRTASTAHKAAWQRRADQRRCCEIDAREAALEAVALGHPAGFDALYQAALAEALGGAR